VNITRTGVLFITAAGATPHAAHLQIVIYLSRAPLDVDDVGVPTPDLYCGGRVARTAIINGGPAIAVQIDFEWAEAPPGRLWDTGI
jgi:hypothetical protein